MTRHRPLDQRTWSRIGVLVTDILAGVAALPGSGAQPASARSPAPAPPTLPSVRIVSALPHPRIPAALTKANGLVPAERWALFGSYGPGSSQENIHVVDLTGGHRRQQESARGRHASARSRRPGESEMPGWEERPGLRPTGSRASAESSRCASLTFGDLTAVAAGAELSRTDRPGTIAIGSYPERRLARHQGRPAAPGITNWTPDWNLVQPGH